MTEKKCTSKECRSKEQEENVIELGKFYFLNGKYEAALEEFLKAKKFDPKNYEIYYNLGIVYEALNELGKAKEMYLKCLELNDRCEKARQHLEKIVGK